MAYQITGRIRKIGEKENVSKRYGSSYYTRELVIDVVTFDPHTGRPTVDDNNTPRFTFRGDYLCDKLSQFAAGDEVVINFEVRGRSYTNERFEVNYFTDLNPVKIWKRGAASEAPIEKMQLKEPENQEEEKKVEEEVDDLPF